MTSPGAYIYVLHGEDVFSRDEAAGAILDRMRALPAGEHNIAVLEGADANLKSLRTAADAAPFLAERRLVVVKGLLGRLQGKGGGGTRRGRSKSAAGPGEENTQLLEYLGDVPATTSIMFLDSTIQSDAVEAAIPRGRAFVRAYPKVQDVARWIRERARKLDIAVDESAVRELAMLGGDDLRRLDNEIRKLGAYADGRVIQRDDVQELVVGRDTITWALLDALAERRLRGALTALRSLYAQGESPDKLFAADVVPLYRRLLAAKELSLLPQRERGSIDVAALGLNPRTLPRLFDQVRQFDRVELERALELLLETDRAAKTGEADIETALELLVVQLCSRLGAANAAA